jgi:hypothetical protein
MSDELFTDPEESRDEWVDVRMTDPDEGEWDVDVVIVEGTVEYVDLRIRPELLTDFVDCLADDVGERRVEALLDSLAGHHTEETDAESEADTESDADAV